MNLKQQERIDELEGFVQQINKQQEDVVEMMKKMMNAFQKVNRGQ